nr:hypothetical protein BaRGS_030061 [Batillaria attramentaria]
MMMIMMMMMMMMMMAMIRDNHMRENVLSAARQDEKWVREHLMPELEGRLGLRLCLHFRDFIPVGTSLL